MQRFITAGLTVLLVSFVAPDAKAETRAEHQLRLTHPAPIAKMASAQPKMEPSAQPKANGIPVSMQSTSQPESTKLSERDRLIQERQQQIVIPVQ